LIDRHLPYDGLLHEVVEHNGLLYLGGIVPEDTSVDMAGQANNVLGQTKELLAVHGSDPSKVLQTTVYVTNLNEKSQLNAVWKAHFAAREDEVSRRLMTIPGIGPISATAIAALAPPVETFAKGRDFAAWLGLTPLQRSTGGKQKLGTTSKMGETHAQAPPHHRQRRRRTAGEQTRRAKGFVARTDAGSQTAHAGNGRARQQDGADHLGTTYKAGKLQSSGRSQGVSLADLRSS
jgi:enamine deaminase RidA (YjgF/YER057c/UK114 family)